jgi:Phage integrase family
VGQLAEVKTERGRRAFGLPELALYALRAQRVQQARERLKAGTRWIDSDYVFTTNDGRPVSWRSLDAAFVRAQTRAGVRRQRFHDMRHAFATLLLDAGEEIAVISKMLGHADYSTTVDVYSHLSRERSRVAAARIDGLLKRREAPLEAAHRRTVVKTVVRPPSGRTGGGLLMSEIWSGRPDLNRRPPVPQTGALPDCATPRERPQSSTRSWARRASEPGLAGLQNYEFPVS